LAFNFNNEPETLTIDGPDRPRDQEGAAPAEPAAPQQADDAASAPAQAPVQESAAWVRFRSCRWHQPKEAGNAEFCTHREVKPYAGTTGFDAEAWCPDCQYYKLRRSPKKKAPGDEYTY
jgi:hypothetical protein